MQPRETFEGKKIQRNVLHSSTCHSEASQDVDSTVAYGPAALLDKITAKCFYRNKIYKLLTYLSVKEKAKVNISVRGGRNVISVDLVTDYKTLLGLSVALW